MSQPARPGSRVQYVKAFSALRMPQYRWYFISGMGMAAGQGIQQLALAWLVLDLTGGSLGRLGITIFVRGVPMIAFGLVGGVLADRYNRRNLLISNQIITLVSIVVVALLAMSDRVEMWHIYLSSTVLGASFSLTGPARNAMIRSLVDAPEMPNAIALNWLQMNASRVVWPTMAGGLIAATGADWALLLSAAGFLIGVVFLLPIHERGAPDRGPSSSPIADIVEAVNYAFAMPLIKMVLSLAVVIGTFGLAFQNLAPAFAKEELELNASQTGLFLMSIGIGSIVGSSLILFVEVRNRHLLFAALAASFALSLIALAAAPWTIASFFLVGVFGVFNAPLPVTAQTILQTLVPPRLIGRVLSVLMLAPALGTVATLPMGLVADAIGLRATVGGCAFALLIATVLITGYQLPRINRILKDQGASVESVAGS